MTTPASRAKSKENKFAAISGWPVLIGLFIFSWTDREQPDEIEDTDDDEARRYLADKEGEE